MPALRFYDSIARSKVAFEPLKPDEVRIYSCGPTVYSHQHIGNMRPYVFADVLKRTLNRFGYRVRQVINITDVGHLTDDADAGEDKMELAARREGASAWDVAERYTRQFKEDIEALAVLDPDVWAKATDHIPQQIAMVQLLEERGLTYPTSDGIYFDTSKDPSYPRMGGQRADDRQAQDRIARADEKRNPTDFALWKLSGDTKRQMEWPSPWGVGFPGWHIECSAMSSEYLGRQFDIHTGGVDHVPVHHPNEIAQSENAFGVRPWVRYWMHNGWVMFGDAKISKSSGGLLNLGDLVDQGFAPLAYRYFLLGAVYRQPISYTEEAMEAAASAYRRLLRRAAELSEAPAGAEPPADYVARFDEAMADDLNTPQALAVLWDAVKSDLEPAAKRALLQDFDAVLGLGLSEARAEGEVDERIDGLVAERQAARASRDFARADAIRDALAAEGIVLEDGPEGTSWSRGGG